MFSECNAFLPDNVASVLLGVEGLLCRDTVRVVGGGREYIVSDFLLKNSIIFLFLLFFFRFELDFLLVLMGGGGGVRVVVEAGRGDDGDLPMQLVVSEGRGSEGFLLLLLAVLFMNSRELLLLL